MRVGSPAEMTRSVEHVLDAHLQDHVGMCAHPWPLRRNVAKQRVEGLARLALMDRIDPDEHAIDGEQLIADGVGEDLVVDHRAGVDADRGECFENADEAAVLCRRVPARRSVAAGKDGNGMAERRVAFGIHAQAPRMACCAELGPRSHGESASSPHRSIYVKSSGRCKMAIVRFRPDGEPLALATPVAADSGRMSAVRARAPSTEGALRPGCASSPVRHRDRRRSRSGRR